MRILAAILTVFWVNFAMGEGNDLPPTKAEIAANVASCLQNLTSGRVNSLTVEALGYVIENEFGNGPYPAQLQRQYLRRASGELVAALTFKVKVITERFRRLSVILDFVDLPDEAIGSLVSLTKVDLDSRMKYATMNAITDPNKPVMRGYVAHSYSATTGYRHLLRTDEARNLFIHLDAILAHRLSETRLIDSVQMPVVENPK